MSMTLEEFEDTAAELARLNKMDLDEARLCLSEFGDTVPIEDDGTVIWCNPKDGTPCRLIWPEEEG